MLTPRSKRFTKKKMFSIVELLGVIAIMSIITAIVATALKPDPMKSTARRIAGAMSKARSYALANRIYVRLHVKPAAAGDYAEIQTMDYYSDTADTTVDGIVPGTTPQVLHKSVSLESGGNDDFFIVFGPNGASLGSAVDFGTSNISNLNPGSSNYIQGSNKYEVEMIDRRGSDTNYYLRINKFTGTASVE